MRPVLSIAIALALIALPHGRPVLAQSPSTPTGVVAQIATGNASFGFRLLAKLALARPQDNIFISPLSLGNALALAYNGAKGRTASEIGDVLGLGRLSLEQADEGFGDLNVSVASADPKTEIDVANALWAKAGGKAFAKDYVDRCQRYLDASPQTLDFLSPSAADMINQWVAEKTKDKITQIIQPPMLRRCEAVLTNAVYFHGTWADPFNPRRTHEAPFYKLDGTNAQAQMMSIESRYGYWSSDDFQVIEVPYGNRRLSMVVMLPKLGTGLSKLLGDMTVGEWQTVLGNLKSTLVALSLPRFTIRYNDPNMGATLGDIGMPTAMSRNADFSGTGIPGLHIGAVVHIATMDVDEEGTVASAATGIMMMPLAIIAGPTAVMTVDHPFFCAICDSVTGAVLFAGVVQDPVSSQ
jgi:serine protease inhibitor